MPRHLGLEKGLEKGVAYHECSKCTKLCIKLHIR